MKAAVICSKGIGDALMMLIASFQLSKKGYRVTTFTNHHKNLSPLFPYSKFACMPVGSQTQDELNSFDCIILQKGDKKLCDHIFLLSYKNLIPKLFVFHNIYKNYRQTPHNCIDMISDPLKPLAHNIAESIASILNQELFCLKNGIVISSKLDHRKYKNRILIHPTSGLPQKNWSASKFLAVAKRLKKSGFNPVFCVSSSERDAWIKLTQEKFLVPHFPTLKDLAYFIYESNFLIGNDSCAGHLASNLGLPTLIIAKCPRLLLLWRPGWHPGGILAPSPIIPNMKGMRLREDFWQAWISPKKVLRKFNTMIHNPSYQ